MGISLSTYTTPTESLRRKLVDFADDILDRRVRDPEEVLVFLKDVNMRRDVDWQALQAQYHTLVSSIFKKIVNVENAREIIEAFPVVYRVFSLSNVCLRTDPELIEKVFDIASEYYITASSKTQALVVARSIYYLVSNYKESCLNIALDYFKKHVDHTKCILAQQIVSNLFDDVIHGHPKNVNIMALKKVLKWLEVYFDSVQLDLRLSDNAEKKRDQVRILKAFDEDRKLVIVNRTY